MGLQNQAGLDQDVVGERLAQDFPDLGQEEKARILLDYGKRVVPRSL